MSAKPPNDTRTINGDSRIRINPLIKLHRLIEENSRDVAMNRPRVTLFYLKAFYSLVVGNMEKYFYQRRLNNYHPKHQPVFVIGHWRSGTSFMQSLLGEAPGYIYFNKFQSIFPVSFLLTRKYLKPLINYLFLQSPIAKNWKKNLAHNFSSLDSASELEIAMINHVFPHSFHWGHVFPWNWKKYFDRYLFMDDIDDEEYKNWGTAVYDLNKKVNFTDPDSRLLVKNPGDTARVKHLLNIYPNAKFIFLHRNPYDVFYSNIKLWNKLFSHFSLQKGHPEIKEIILYVYKRMHQKYLEDRELIPEGQLVEVDFETFSRKPENSLKKIYKQLNLPDFNKNKSFFSAYLKGLKHHQGAYEYQREDIEKINEEWGFVFEAFGYNQIVSKRAMSV